jgi:hypothetical protein
MGLIGFWLRPKAALSAFVAHFFLNFLGRIRASVRT